MPGHLGKTCIFLRRVYCWEQGVSDRAHAWRPMNNSFGAAWELSDLYPPPFDLRLRDNVGRTVIVKCDRTFALFSCTHLSRIFWQYSLCKPPSLQAGETPGSHLAQACRGELFPGTLMSCGAPQGSSDTLVVCAINGIPEICHLPSTRAQDRKWSFADRKPILESKG